MKKQRIQRNGERPFAAAWVCGVALFGLLGICAMGSEPMPANAVDTLFPDAPPASSPKTDAPQLQQNNTEKQLLEVEQRLTTLETRLGKASRPPSLAYNVERRLADLEQRVQKIEQQQKQMLSWEQRIRRLEMK